MKLTDAQEKALKELSFQDPRVKEMLELAIIAWKKIGYDIAHFGFSPDIAGEFGVQNRPCCLIGGIVYGKVKNSYYCKIIAFFIKEFNSCFSEAQAIMKTFDGVKDHHLYERYPIIREDVLKIRNVLFSSEYRAFNVV